MILVELLIGTETETGGEVVMEIGFGACGLGTNGPDQTIQLLKLLRGSLLYCHREEKGFLLFQIMSIGTYGIRGIQVTDDAAVLLQYLTVGTEMLPVVFARLQRVFANQVPVGHIFDDSRDRLMYRHLETPGVIFMNQTLDKPDTVFRKEILPNQFIPRHNEGAMEYLNPIRMFIGESLVSSVSQIRSSRFGFFKQFLQTNRHQLIIAIDIKRIFPLRDLIARIACGTESTIMFLTENSIRSICRQFCFQYSLCQRDAIVRTAVIDDNHLKTTPEALLANTAHAGPNIGSYIIDRDDNADVHCL